MFDRNGYPRQNGSPSDQRHGETQVQFHGDEGAAEDRTAMPHSLKTGLETLSGMDLSDIRVHNNSPKPAQLNALAYTQGRDIYMGPGQEKHLPHEGWHVVQQMQGRVDSTRQFMGLSVNDDPQLEREADEMGSKVLQSCRAERSTTCPSQNTSTLKQHQVGTISKSNGATDNHAQSTIQMQSKTVFQNEGWKNNAYVKDSTAGIIDAALKESKILSPYIKGKLDNSSIAGKKFEIHESDAEFLGAYQKAYNVVIVNVKEKAFLNKTWGFYDPKKDTIHLQPRSRNAHALHETIHKLSDFSRGKSYFKRIFGSSALNEGVTQYFTDCILREQKMGISTSHKYQKRLACAKKLVTGYGFDLVAKAFFLGDLELPKKMKMKHREFVPKNCKDID